MPEQYRLSRRWRQHIRNRARLLLLLALVSILTACSSAPPAPLAKAEPQLERRGPAPFVHPLPGARISSSFANYIVKSRGRMHHGIDFAAPKGTPVYAASSGVVISADQTSLNDAFGKAVLIEHGDQLTSLSAHLSRIDVQLGDFVQAGQQIGLVGATGRATGPHLHFELWRGSVPQDPKKFLPLSPLQRTAQQPGVPADRSCASTDRPATDRHHAKSTTQCPAVAPQRRSAN